MVEIGSPLKEKVKEFPDLTDWQISNILNDPDNSLPMIVALQSRLVGPGLIMETIGEDEGAALLDTMQQLSQVSSIVKWAMKLVEKDGIDAASPAFRKQLDKLVTMGKVSEDAARKIKGLAEVARYPSWAEHNKIEVTPRTVGLARGGK